MWVEVHQVGVGSDTQGVRGSILMEGGKVRQAQSCQQEGQQVVQAEEAVEGGVVHAEPSPQPGHNRTAHHRNGTRQAGNHGSSPQGHLPPRQHIPNEGSQDHDQKQDHTQQPHTFTRLGVAAVEQAPEQVGVNHYKKERGAVGVQVSKQPTMRHVPHQVLDTGESQVHMCRVVHSQEDPGQDLGNQTQACEHSPVPIPRQVCWRRIAHQMTLYQTQNRLMPQAASHTGSGIHATWDGWARTTDDRTKSGCFSP